MSISIALLARLNPSNDPIIDIVLPNTDMYVCVNDSIVALALPPSPIILALSLIKSFCVLASARALLFGG